jgi:hypothetical protein
LLGPLTAGSVNLDEAVFVRPVVITAAAAAVSCCDATWNAGVTLQLRYAEVDLERATFTAPSFVTGADQPYPSPVWALPERLDEGLVRNLVGERSKSRDGWIPLLTSLSSSDTANLSVTDVDLSKCRFAGTRLLDQLRLEGRCIFDRPPPGVRTGWAWPPAWRWSSRQSIAEERTWRATTRKHAGWSNVRSSEPAEVSPERLAGLYRQLRKAQEDAKNEPGAADFYYGEMEMRRRAATTPFGERFILWLYWLISGYGLRALRSLAALAILAVLVTTLLVGWGLASAAPPQNLTGTVTSSAGNHNRIDATLNTATPRLPPAGKRWTGQRAWTAVEVTLDSIVFRATDQPLTTLGSWITDAEFGRIFLAFPRHPFPVLSGKTLMDPDPESSGHPIRQRSRESRSSIAPDTCIPVRSGRWLLAGAPAVRDVAALAVQPLSRAVLVEEAHGDAQRRDAPAAGQLPGRVHQQRADALPAERPGYGKLVHQRNAAAPEPGVVRLRHDRGVSDGIVTAGGEQARARRFCVIGQVPARLAAPSHTHSARNRTASS